VQGYGHIKVLPYDGARLVDEIDLRYLIGSYMVWSDDFGWADDDDSGIKEVLPTLLSNNVTHVNFSVGAPNPIAKMHYCNSLNALQYCTNQLNSLEYSYEVSRQIGDDWQVITEIKKSDSLNPMFFRVRIPDVVSIPA